MHPPGGSIKSDASTTFASYPLLKNSLRVLYEETKTFPILLSAMSFLPPPPPMAFRQ